MAQVNGAATTGRIFHSETFRFCQRWGPWVVVVLAILLTATVRFRLREMPLERDEGEYAYAGQLLLQGVPPYQLTYTAKLPGTSAMYAAIMAAFGQTPAGIRLGLIAVVSGTTVLVFLLGRLLLNAWAGAVAAATHAIMSLGPWFLGIAGHAAHFVLLPSLAGLLLLLLGLEGGKRFHLLAAGFLLGIGVLMKQPGLWFVLFGILYAVYFEWNLGKGIRAKREDEGAQAYQGFGIQAGLVVLGAIIPMGVTVLLLAGAGVFRSFWFWSVQYALAYGTQVTLGEGLSELVRILPEYTGPVLGLCVLAGIGVVAMAGDRGARERLPFALGLVIFGFLAASAGFYWRGHYFLFLVPGAAILAGAAMALLPGRIGRLPWKLLMAFVFAASLIYPLIRERTFLFYASPEQAARLIYGPNPFPESVQLAAYLNKHTTADERLAVLGSEPQIYFYSQRQGTTGHIYTYPLMEPQPFARRMQQQMIADIEAAKPAYLIYVNVMTSWLLQPESDQEILNWLNAYMQRHYDLVGVVDIQTPEHTEYRWDEAAVGYQPLSPSFVLVLRRKTES